MAEIIKLTEATYRCLFGTEEPANALGQSHAGRKLHEAPRMLLVGKLLQTGRSSAVLEYLDICAKFEFPGGGEYGGGRLLTAPSQMISAIRAAIEPRFSNLDLY